MPWPLIAGISARRNASLLTTEVSSAPGGLNSAPYAYGFVTGSMGSHDRSDTVENAFRGVLGMGAL